MLQTRVQGFLRQSACAIAILALALPALARSADEPMDQSGNRMQSDQNQNTTANPGNQEEKYNENINEENNEENNEAMNEEPGENPQANERGEQWRESGREMLRRHFGKPQQIEGKVVNILSRRMPGGERTFARIETSNHERILVDLGPQNEFQDRFSQLKKGDQITVTGFPLPVVAEKVEFNGRTVALNPGLDHFVGRLGRFAQARGLRYSGEILSTRHANFVGFNQPHMLARLRLDNENWQPEVDLGPTQDVRDLNLQSGDHISFVAREGCINGQGALIADELRTPNGQFVELDNFAGQGPPMMLRGRPVGPQEQGMYREGRPGMRERGDWQQRRNQSMRGQEQGPTTRPSGNYNPSTQPSGNYGDAMPETPE
jgi:hypothetical protein